MTPAVVLVATIAIAAGAGTAVSLAQRPPPAPAHHPSPSPDVVETPPANKPAVAFGFSVAADLATSPAGRYGASSAFDPRIGEVLLFGGTLATGENAHDTWAWDGRNWQEL